MSKPTFLIRGIVCVLVVLAMSWANAAPTRAGTYVMRSCNVPGYPSAPIGPWQAAPSPSTAVIDTCASGGSAAISFPGVPYMPYHARAELNLIRPAQGPGSRIGFAGIRLWAAARLSGSGGRLSIQTFRADSDSAGHGFSLSIPSGDGASPLDWSLYAPTTSAINLALVCNDPPDRPVPGTRVAAEDCYPADRTPLVIRGIELRLEENTAPAASIDGGTVLASGPQSGERTMQFTASDLESGVEKVEAVIGDTVVGSRDLGPQCPHVGFAACPESDKGVLTVDTRAVPNGTHGLTLRVTDAAGNAQIVPAAKPIEIANASAPSVPAATTHGVLPAQGQARLTARFSSSSRSAIVVPFGRTVVLRGRLSIASARPPAGTRIAVVQRTTAAGARERTTGSAPTRADGTFSYRLALRGPSRSVRFVYPADPPVGVSAKSNSLRIRVRAASQFAVSLRGTTLDYRGQVISAPVPRRGKRIELWGRAPGYAWKRFRTLGTDRRGRFAGHYRLRARRPGVRLQVQVRIPAEKGYPYLTYRSGPRTVEVT